MGTRELALRVRRIANGAGEVYTSLTVHCPRQGASVEIAECEACADGRGVGYDERAARSLVRCAAPENFSPGAAERTCVGAVMSGDVICVTADLGADELAALLVDRGFSGAPVVDGEGRPIGVVSKTDLVREAGAPACATVGDLMTPLAFTLPEHAPLARAVALMAEERVHRLPIVSDDGRVVGVLTAFDVVRWLAHAR